MCVALTPQTGQPGLLRPTLAVGSLDESAITCQTNC